MGAADVVPGVSGGTMAFILGVYDELLASIRAFNPGLLKLVFRGRFLAAFDHVNGRFLVALLAGLGSAILSLAHGITWLLDHHPDLLFAFFFGLVLASILTIGAHVQWTSARALACAVGAYAAYRIVRLVPLDMPNNPLTLFWAAAVAIMAMILPGISGSFILFILGQYRFVMEAVKRFDVLTLLPFVAGVATGLLAFSHVLGWLLRVHRQLTITLLTGFMIGSLWKIWPFRRVLETATKPDGEVIPVREAVILPEFSTGSTWAALGLCVLGFLLVLGLERLANRRPAA
jgi:putative membrane protein